MEVDTGSPVTILKLSDFKKINASLNPTTISLRRYTGDKINLIGESFVNVSDGKTSFKAT